MKRVVPSVAFLLLLLCPAPPRAQAQGGSAVGGVVRDLHGTPQMGALIELVGADASVVARTFSDEHGRYLLSTVSPGRYELRASAAFALPALRANLLVVPGVRVLADLTMTAMVEVGGLFPAQRRSADEPADDWRWTLRSSANRPLLRVAGDDESDGSSPEAAGFPRAGAQGRASVFANEGQFGESGIHQTVSLNRSAEAGTTEELSADLGVAGVTGAAGSMALEAGYERETPFGGRTRMVAGFSSEPGIEGPGGNGLETMVLATGERLNLGDAVMIDAGTLLSAERLVSTRVKSAPYVRLVVAPGPGYAVMYRYAASRELQSSDDLDELRVQPDALSNPEGDPILVRDDHQELAISHHTTSDTETISIYHDDLPIVGLQGTGRLSPNELAGVSALADAEAGAVRIAVAGYVARGAGVSWTHSFAPSLAASFAADLGSALARGGAPLTTDDVGQDLRSRLAPALTATVHGKVARTGTAFRAQYRWQPDGTVDTVDAFNVAPNQAYLSFSVRQRLWSGRRLRGVNAVIEASNLLEQGYQPMIGPDGETLFLAQVPRTLQAGLSFSF